MQNGNIALLHWVENNLKWNRPFPYFFNNYKEVDKYCAFWYPTIYHTSLLNMKRRDIVEVTISDFGEPDTRLIIKLENGEKEDLSDHSLVFSVKDGNGKSLFNAFELICVKTFNNGIAIYQYNIPINYPIEAPRSFEECLVTVFYHHAKAIFHNHEVQAERDCGVKALLNISSEFNDGEQIKKINDEIIFHYLCQFEEIFHEYAELLSQYIKYKNALVSRFDTTNEVPDEPTSLLGYNEIIAYGASSFKRWFKNASQEEQKIIRKDAYRYSRYLKPKKKFKKRNIDYYSLRLLALYNYWEKDKENRCINSRIAGIITNLTNFIVKYNTKTEWKKLDVWEVNIIDIQLLECEMFYNIGIPRWSSRRCYNALKKASMDWPGLIHGFRQNISMLCENVLTEYVYCKTLLESKYNVTVNHRTTEEMFDRGRKTACNIRNSIRYTETVKYRNSNAYSDSTMMALDKADKLSSYAEKWTITGVVLTVLGLLLTFLNFNFVKDIIKNFFINFF